MEESGGELRGEGFRRNFRNFSAEKKLLRNLELWLMHL